VALPPKRCFITISVSSTGSASASIGPPMISAVGDLLGRAIEPAASSSPMNSAAGIAHEDLRRRLVPRIEADEAPGEGGHDHERKRVVAKDGDHAERGRDRDRHDGRQRVHAVDEVHGVHHADDPEHRRDRAEEPRSKTVPASETKSKWKPKATRMNAAANCTANFFGAFVPRRSS
jgi:hypothetical protein